MSEAAEAGATPEAGEAQAIDFSPVEDRVNQLATDLGSRLDGLEGLLRPQEPEAEETDPWAALLGEEEPEPQTPQMDPQALQQAVNAAIQQGIEQHVGPLHDQVAQMRTEQDLNGLYEKYPDLKDPDTRQRTGQAARELAERIVGPENASLLTNSAEFIANVHEALAGRERAAGEVPATGDTAQLEGGGGAAPGGVEQPNIIQQVIAARKHGPKGFR